MVNSIGFEYGDPGSITIRTDVGWSQQNHRLYLQKLVTDRNRNRPYKTLKLNIKIIRFFLFSIKTKQV